MNVEASSMDKMKKYLKKQYQQMIITNDYWSYVIWHELDDDADFDKDYYKMVIRPGKRIAASYLMPGFFILR